MPHFYFYFLTVANKPIIPKLSPPSIFRHVLNCLVQNEPGVLSRVSGILAGRGFNIDSLVVCRTEIRDLSRMCIVISGQDGVVEQARRQLEDLVRHLTPSTNPCGRQFFFLVSFQVPVWAVLDYTETRTISRELLLVKVSILGPEYLDDQLTGGPSHEPRASHRAHAEQTKLERETALARHFEESNRPQPTLSSSSAVEGGAKPLTPSEALRMRHQHLQSLHVLANQFGARIVDVSENSIILEMSGKTSRVEAFLSLVKPFGIIESARTGTFLRRSVTGVYAGQKLCIVYRVCRADFVSFFRRFDGYAANPHRRTVRGGSS